MSNDRKHKHAERPRIISHTSHRWKCREDVCCLPACPSLPFFRVVAGVDTGWFGGRSRHTLFQRYFVQHLGASSALFGLIDGGANGMNALLTLVAPLLALRFGKINTVVFTCLISIPLLLIFGFTSVLPLAALLYLFRQGAMDMSSAFFKCTLWRLYPCRDAV